jgi:hypothetical protein
MIVTWILIILGSNNGSVNSIEFTNEPACLVAKQKIENYRGGTNVLYSAICTPKSVKADQK